MQFRFFGDPDIFRRSARDIMKSIDDTSKRLLMRAIVMVILSALLLSLSPLYMAKIIDTMTVRGQESSHDIIAYALLYLVLRFVGQACVDLRWVVINPVLYAISYSLCTLTASRFSNIFRHEGRTGDSAAVIAEQVSVMSKMGLGSISLLYGVLAVIIPTTIELLIVCVAVGIVIGPWLVLYMIVGGLIFMFAVSFKRGKELSSADATHQLDNIVSASFAEYIANPSLVREFGADQFMRTRLSQTITDSVIEHRRFFSIKTERSLYLTATTAIVYSVVLLSAIFSKTSIAVSAGGFFLLVIYLDRILQPLTNASAAINNIQNGLVSMHGAYALLQALEQNAIQKPFATQSEWKEIFITSEPCFTHVEQTLHIGKGAWIRFDGPSGSGKSTYLRRIYHQLLTDTIYSGADIHYLNPTPILIQGSIFDNMALGDPSITREKSQAYWLEWHLRVGNNHIDIDTDIKQLSAGETQFLAICRTLARNPKLVIFDEATNSIDIASESKVWAMIKKHLPKATVFVVSHRDIEDICFDHQEILE